MRVCHNTTHTFRIRLIVSYTCTQLKNENWSNLFVSVCRSVHTTNNKNNCRKLQVSERKLQGTRRVGDMSKLTYQSNGAKCWFVSVHICSIHQHV